MFQQSEIKGVSRS